MHIINTIAHFVVVWIAFIFLVVFEDNVVLKIRVSMNQSIKPTCDVGLSQFIVREILKSLPLCRYETINGSAKRSG